MQQRAKHRTELTLRRRVFSEHIIGRPAWRIVKRVLVEVGMRELEDFLERHALSDEVEDGFDLSYEEDGVSSTPKRERARERASSRFEWG
jgi:hypothetical protein